jgi:Rrf2 family protein
MATWEFAVSINSQFSVSLHILTLLAKSPKDPLSSSAIAESVGTNAALVRKIMGRLMAAELIKVERGREGGALLAKPPKKITLRLVYLAVIEGPLHRVHSNGGQKCPIGKNSLQVFTLELQKCEEKYLRALEGQNIEGLLNLF